MLFNKMKLETEMTIVVVTYAVLAMTVTGCATTRVASINTEVESGHGMVQGQLIAVDTDGKAIIQEEVDAQNELRLQIWKNADIRAVLESYYADLEICVRDTQDPRLGWNGTPIQIPDLDRIELQAPTTEEFGKTSSGDLKVVRKTVFIERLKSERTLESNLIAFTKIVQKRYKECNRDLRTARINAGYPGVDYHTVNEYDRLQNVLSMARH
jgi:hypothetical protein